MILIVAFLLVGLTVATGLAQGFDQALLSLVGAVRNAPSARLAAFLSDAGSFWGRTGLALLGAGWLLYRGQRSAALQLVLIVGLGAILIVVLKDVTDRPRPAEALRLASVGDTSFPSAHAGNTMIVGLAMALIMVRERRRAVALAAALIATGLVGLSRVMLWVHWPTDVIAGWCLGAGWVLGWLALFRPARRPG